MHEAEPARPDETTLPPSAAPLVLGYRGAAPAVAMPGHVSFQREGDVLTIVAGAPPFAWQMVSRAFVLLVWLLLLIASTAFSAAVLNEARGGAPELVLAAFVLIGCTGWATTTSLRRLVHIALGGRHPTIIRAGPEMLEVSLRGRIRPLHRSWATREIADVEVRPGGAAPGLFPVLILQISMKDGQFHRFGIPWRAGCSMIEVQDNLRDVMRLPGTELA